MLVQNLLNELVPTPGRSPLSGKSFTRAQFDPNTEYAFISVETADLTVRFDGGTGAPNTTLAKGTTGTWKLNLLLAAKFEGEGAVAVHEMTR